MSSIFDKENNKEKCQKFTPVEMVETMLDLIGYNNNLVGKKVLENSFGSGNILIAIVRRYIADCNNQRIPLEQISQGLSEDIVGIEYDKIQFKKCKKILKRIEIEYGLPKVNWNIHNADALKWKYRVKFDYIIGNPPYISYRNIDQDSRKMIRFNFNSCKFGKFDYCYAFIELGIRNLSANGKMVQLIPSNIFKNVYAESLRKMLQQNVTVIFDYPTQNIFKSTLTSSSILLYEKICESKYIKYKNITQNSELTINRNKLQGKWMFSDDELNNDNQIRFGDYYNASITIATLCNEAFVLTEEQIEKYGLESEIIKPAVSPRSFRFNREEYIIFPYFYINGELKHISVDEFSKRFPAVEMYLQNYKDKLSARDNDKNINWFEYGRSQALAHLNKCKLLLSTVITNTVEIYKLDSDTIPYSGIYITPLRDGYTLAYAEEILKSEEFLEYVKKVGIPVSGSSIRITCKDINNYRFVRR